MAITSFINPDRVSAGAQPAERAPTGFLDIVPASFRQFRNEEQSNSAARLTFDERSKNIELVNELLGREIKASDASDYKPQVQKRLPDFPENPFFSDLDGMQSKLDQRQYEDDYIDKAIAELKASDPVKYAAVKTPEEIKEAARQRANLTKEEYDKVIAAAPSRYSRFFGTLIGGLGAAATDPVNIVASALPFGASKSVGILGFMLREAVINAGAEAAIQPYVVDWKQELGREYGFVDAAENVGIAALFGGAVGGVAKGAKPAASWMYNKIGNMKEMPSAGKLASKYLSKVAHLRENTPFVGSKRGEHIKRHKESMDAAVGSVVKGEPVKPEDIKVTETEFQSIDTTIKETDSPIVAGQKDEIARFQDNYVDMLPVLRAAVGRVKTLLSDKENFYNSEATRIKSEIEALLGEKKKRDPSQTRRNINKQVSKLRSDLERIQSEKAKAFIESKEALADLNNQIARKVDTDSKDPLKELKRQRDRILKSISKDPKASNRASLLGSLEDNIKAAKSFVISRSLTRDQMLGYINESKRAIESFANANPAYARPILEYKAALLEQLISLPQTGKQLASIKKEFRRTLKELGSFGDYNPTYVKETLPQQVLNKANKPGNLTSQDFQPEELEMLKSAGIEPNAKQQIRKGPLLDEFARREKLGALQDVRGKENEHITQYNRQADINARQAQVETSRARVADENAATAASARLDEEVLGPAPKAARTAEEIIESLESEANLDATLRNFDDLLASNPNKVITTEDGEITIADLKKLWEAEENYVNHIRECGLE